uniref:Uncharacterized protein n=1 Tax=Oryza nivara TaxID=4536 RepID=A0A0E0FHU6_ORYNI
MSTSSSVACSSCVAAFRSSAAHAASDARRMASVLTSARAAMAVITRLYMCSPRTARSSNQERDAADERAAMASTQRPTMPSSSACGSSSSQDLSALASARAARLSSACSSVISRYSAAHRSGATFQAVSSTRTP